MPKCLPTLKGSAYAVLKGSAYAILFVASSVGCHGTPQAPLERGSYQSLLVRLQQLVGDNDHLHTDEVRYRAADGLLFHCSYNFGVIDARDPERMVYLAQELRHRIPGDRRQPGCIHLAWDGDTVYTAHRGNIDNPAFLSGWRLRRDTAAPEKLSVVQLPVLQEPGVSYEGIDTANGLIYVALRRGGLGIYRPSPTGFHRVGTFTGLDNAWGVRVRGNTAFVTDGLGGLAVVDVTDGGAPALLGRAAIDGQARGLAIDGQYAYVMFAGNWHVIHSFRVHPDRRAPSLVLPENVNLVDFGPVAPGGRARVPLAIRNQGTAALTVFDAAIDHPSFSVEPRELPIPAGETATFTLGYAPPSTDTATAMCDPRS